MTHRSNNCDGISIELLGSFGVQARGEQLRLPLSVQRVIAVLAVHDHVHDRPLLAATLYPNVPPQQVSANLRSALWRTRRDAGQGLLQCAGHRITLREGVRVDLRDWAHRARHLVSCSVPVPPEDVGRLLAALSRELLPSWDENWRSEEHTSELQSRQ